jgi:hypothetical protein
MRHGLRQAEETELRHGHRKQDEQCEITATFDAQEPCRQDTADDQDGLYQDPGHNRFQGRPTEATQNSHLNPDPAEEAEKRISQQPPASPLLQHPSPYAKHADEYLQTVSV